MPDNSSKPFQFPQGSAASQSLVCCRVCHQVASADSAYCERCGEKLQLRKPFSVQICLALLVTALVLFIPANMYPIMNSQLLGNTTPSTILGGVVNFLEHGSYFIALVIFTASIFIPLVKIGIIAWLCISTQSKRKLNHNELTRLYRITEFIGKWSMIDVFVVAVLVSLVQLTGIMTIEPGLAARSFTGVVIFTMLAAQQFDIRLIWDRLKTE